MPSLRTVLFQIHLWTGLSAGLFFIVLGLSGSALVYPSLLQPSLSAPSATAKGSPLPLEQIIAAARSATPQSQGRPSTIALNPIAGGAVVVEFNPQAGGREGQANRRGAQPGGRGEARQPANGGAAVVGQTAARTPPRRGGILQVFVDPVSAKVLAAGSTVNSPMVGLAHQLHQAMLLDPIGRGLVAWLGVGMFFLGLSGLYLWWPKPGQWKSAFGVRRKARGFRIYRELHGAVGVWFWLVFVVVTVTSLPLGFPAVLGLLTGDAPRGRALPPGASPVPVVEVAEGSVPMHLEQLIAKAESAGNSKAVSITVPAQPGRAVTITLEPRFGEFAPPPVALNPYTGAILSPLGDNRNTGITRRMIEQLHGGAGFGPVWKFLVFASGFLPLIFVVTGFMMWLKKRQNRSAMRKPAPVSVRSEKPAAAAVRA